jgi:hypothetical protein
MIAAQFVAPYRIQGKSGKNDANDAAAICEAASRPHMNFVPPKTLAQQGMLCVHRLREGLKLRHGKQNDPFDCVSPVASLPRHGPIAVVLSAKSKRSTSQASKYCG